MTTHDHPILLLGAVNLGLASVARWLINAKPFLDILVSLGQVAIAIATVLYIIKKTRLLRGITIGKKYGNKNSED